MKLPSNPATRLLIIIGVCTIAWFALAEAATEAWYRYNESQVPETQPWKLQFPDANDPLARTNHVDAPHLANHLLLSLPLVSPLRAAQSAGSPACSHWQVVAATEPELHHRITLDTPQSLRLTGNQSVPQAVAHPRDLSGLAAAEKGFFNFETREMGGNGSGILRFRDETGNQWTFRWPRFTLES